MARTANPETKSKILNAALRVVRTKGYSATTVDDLCAEAKVTKGAFFHYFKSKEDLAVKAAEHWAEITTQLFSNADYHRLSDPLDRILAYIDFRKELVSGQTPEFTCFVGTMVQEAYSSHPSIRDACQRSIFGHAVSLEKDIAEAKRLYAPNAKWTPKSVALYTQSAIQGAFILAKATEDLDEAIALTLEQIDHLRRYVELLFSQSPKGRSSAA